MVDYFIEHGTLINTLLTIAKAQQPILRILLLHSVSQATSSSKRCELISTGHTASFYKMTHGETRVGISNRENPLRLSRLV